ncbi:MOSC N-terminal beta barrel domain-containing protein [Nostoc sp. FACHB-152]|uniref:MOSC domain-containing protein n=1 Tax=unclassified Nostoc TaxID=2593658 RepID=UPI00168899C2|nr:MULTISPECIES: MOSC N-terminal beta barrel domain-containing protein [unclassified Nostoc]MBD2448074.1 MOSC N-terminal beta barrel domain-containing protein [Nostoc sp. FACHB-152]MBD2466181.1 MOSC N-terminal beta barrel domain-containing protein [Nostoc sp. FACHB-145]
MPHLAKIIIYPIKSLDGVEVTPAKILSSGALECDREFAIVDEQGKFVNGKRHAKIHLLRSQFNIANRTISLQIPDQDLPRVFHLDDERQKLAATLSKFFGFPVSLVQNPVMGFPDDTDSPGPTVISTATLAEVASWFPDVSVEQMPRRVRANIEIDDVPPFWEDQLFAQSDQLVSFKVGDVLFYGVNPCQRCIVPTRHPESGAAYPNFQKIFVQQRQASLPKWANSSRFNHFYRLSVNTRLPLSEVGKLLNIADEVKILSGHN